MFQLMAGGDNGRHQRPHQTGSSLMITALETGVLDFSATAFSGTNGLAPG